MRCEWCRREGEVEAVQDAAGKQFLLCEECREAISSFLREKYPSACAGANMAARDHPREYHLAQSITGGI